MALEQQIYHVSSTISYMLEARHIPVSVVQPRVALVQSKPTSYSIDLIHREPDLSHRECARMT